MRKIEQGRSSRYTGYHNYYFVLGSPEHPFAINFRVPPSTTFLTEVLVWVNDWT